MMLSQIICKIKQKIMECPLCSFPTFVKYHDHPSYVEDLFFDIVYCDHCDTSFVNPRNIDTSLYNQIYSNPQQVSGYNNYSRIGDIILKEKSPLKYLENHSFEYSFVIKELQKNYSKGQKILEVGCGIGYLTYALNSATFDTIGTDIADNVIDNAIQKFGLYYQKGGVDSILLTNRKFDFIVLTEVIEHIPEPILFLKKLELLLNSGGIILLTTPNKNAFSKDALWVTDAPPIHLWWFSARSFKYISQVTSMSYKIINKKSCHKNTYHYVSKSERIDMPIFIPKFDEVIYSPGFDNIKNDQFYSPLKSFFLSLFRSFVCQIPFKNKIIKLRNIFMNNHKTEIPYTMCVKLSKLQESID